MGEVGTVVGFAGGVPLERLDGQLLLEVTVLIPAVLVGVIHQGNARAVRARIVEGANGPTTKDADRLLENAGVLVVPDILANAEGGSSRTSNRYSESGVLVDGARR